MPVSRCGPPSPTPCRRGAAIRGSMSHGCPPVVPCSRLKPAAEPSSGPVGARSSRSSGSLRRAAALVAASVLYTHATSRHTKDAGRSPASVRPASAAAAAPHLSMCGPQPLRAPARRDRRGADHLTSVRQPYKPVPLSRKAGSRYRAAPACHYLGRLLSWRRRSQCFQRPSPHRELLRWTPDPALACTPPNAGGQCVSHRRAPCLVPRASTPCPR